MNIKDLILKYINYRKSLGEKFRTNGNYLKAFSRAVGDTLDINQISAKQVIDFLYGDGPVTSSWFIKYAALLGFYRYGMSRGYVDSSPLPIDKPKRPPPFVPYIYTRDELRQLFKAAFSYQKNRSHVEPYMVNRILLLLYGTGLRLSEALSLTMKDVDLSQNVLTIKQSKFYKGRLVPFSDQLASILNEYLSWRNKRGFPKEGDSSFFYGRHNKSLNLATVESAFERIREKAGICRTDGAKYQPRLHDLRHTFAVHRLTSWYQQNADVQHLLPALSVYMGHTYLSATSVYLTMTNELLQEAGKKFEKYVKEKDRYG